MVSIFFEVSHSFSFSLHSCVQNSLKGSQWKKKHLKSLKDGIGGRGKPLLKFSINQSFYTSLQVSTEQLWMIIMNNNSTQS